MHCDGEILFDEDTFAIIVLIEMKRAYDLKV
jgi:hypothetical protein